MQISPDIFRAYDIRGLSGINLTRDIVRMLGTAVGTAARAKGQQQLVVAGDGRLSTPEFKQSLCEGLTATGVSVLDIGQVPTPLLYFATHELTTQSGIMVTGSHNPPEYNGLKIVINRVALTENALLALRQSIQENQLDRNGHGEVQQTPITDLYIQRVKANIQLPGPLKVILDCGNGIAGAVAPQLFEAIGCEVVPMYCEVDGRFPNHHPDPTEPANLKDLSNAVQAQGADLGLAFDGDGDRLGIVTDKGKIIVADRLLALFSKYVLQKKKGASIVYDVKCSRHLGQVIEKHGGKPIICRTGHSYLKARMKQTGAVLGGEFSGHICFADRWYGFDDALYSGARLLEVLAHESTSADKLFTDIPEGVSTPELKITVPDQGKNDVIEALQKERFGGGVVNTMDGLRVDYEDGWGLIRASNTTPALTLRFEAEDSAGLHRIYDIFATTLGKVAPKLNIPELSL